MTTVEAGSDTSGVVPCGTTGTAADAIDRVTAGQQQIMRSE